MSNWTLQRWFVDQVMKQKSMYWYADEKNVCFGDGYHFYVIPQDTCFITMKYLETVFPNLKSLDMLTGYDKMIFDSNASDTLTSKVKDKGSLRGFEYMDVNGVRLLYINEKYLKEFGYLKDPERFLVLANSKDGYKNPVLFDGEDFTAVILPVRVGGHE